MKKLIDVLNEQKHDYSVEMGKITVQGTKDFKCDEELSIPANTSFLNKGYICINANVSLEENVSFLNKGDVMLSKLTEIPNGTMFVNIGSVALKSCTIIQERVLFGNSGTAYLPLIEELNKNVLFMNAIEYDDPENWDLPFASIKNEKKLFPHKKVLKLPLLNRIVELENIKALLETWDGKDLDGSGYIFYMDNYFISKGWVRVAVTEERDGIVLINKDMLLNKIKEMIDPKELSQRTEKRKKHQDEEYREFYADLILPALQSIIPKLRFDDLYVEPFDFIIDLYTTNKNN